MEEKKERIMNTCMMLAQTIIPTYLKGNIAGVFSCDDQDKVSRAINYCYEKAIEMENKFDNTVNCEDVIALNIDGELDRFYLTGRGTGSYGEVTAHYTNNIDETFKEKNVIDVRTELGLELIERKLNDEFMFPGGDAKNSQKYKIIGIRKTKNSFPIQKGIIEAEKYQREKKEKQNGK